MLVTFFVFVKTNTRKILSNLIYANETEKQLNKQTNKQTNIQSVYHHKNIKNVSFFYLFLNVSPDIIIDSFWK